MTDMKVKDNLFPPEAYQEPPEGIGFQVTQYDPPIPLEINGTAKKFKRIKGIVTCSLNLPGYYLGVGTAYCSHSDDWDLYKGKKLAFKRALDAATKEFRQFAWLDFLSVHPQSIGRRSEKHPQTNGD